MLLHVKTACNGGEIEKRGVAQGTKIEGETVCRGMLGQSKFLSSCDCCLKVLVCELKLG